MQCSGGEVLEEKKGPHRAYVRRFLVRSLSNLAQTPRVPFTIPSYRRRHVPQLIEHTASHGSHL